MSSASSAEGDEVKQRDSAAGAAVSPMTTAEFRANAHKMLDFMCDYFESVEKYPVRSQVEPGYLRKLLPDKAPSKGEQWDSIMADVSKHIVPGITHWQSPNFFAYYPGNTSYPGIMGEMLSATFACIGFSWIGSPACTELEDVVLAWVAKMLDLPAPFVGESGTGGGCIQGTASEATLVACLGARARARHVARERDGAAYDENALNARLVGYHTDQAHGSVNKAFQIAGIPSANVRSIVATGENEYAMDADALEAAIEKDKAAGLVPFFVVATSGTTSSCAFDPLGDIGKVAQRHGLWMHVDSAYAGSACICPEYRPLINGVELADSFNFNMHKWLLTPFDCSLLYVKDRTNLQRALSVGGEYLRNKATESGAVTDFKDLQVPFGRRFRSLKLWMVLRSYGVEQLQEHIRTGCRHAELFTKRIVEDEKKRFELGVKTSLGLVCFRIRPEAAKIDAADVDALNRLNHKLLDAVNESGKLFMIHTKLEGRTTLRFACGGRLTAQRHIEAAWQLIADTADKLINSNKD